MKRFAACFGIDLLGFAVLSNRFHLILRSRPDVVQTWDDAEVARRWLLLCPVRKDAMGQTDEPNEVELNMIRNVRQRLETIRLQLNARNVAIPTDQKRLPPILGSTKWLLEWQDSTSDTLKEN